MAKKDALTLAAERIGSAVGKAQGKAIELRNAGEKAAKNASKKAQKAGSVAKKELAVISKQVESLQKQLVKTTKKLQKALR
ncbi:MAG TPA: hypothetical protein VL913_00495 [Candidatus Micrarchaeaceae archaeon]|nr:hypothetical protein [Candidatus Micrarchaeaceae archaeon]